MLRYAILVLCSEALSHCCQSRGLWITCLLITREVLLKQSMIRNKLLLTAMPDVSCRESSSVVCRSDASKPQDGGGCHKSMPIGTLIAQNTPSCRRGSGHAPRRVTVSGHCSPARTTNQPTPQVVVCVDLYVSITCVLLYTAPLWLSQQQSPSPRK
jgi:hypothetical protein